MIEGVELTAPHDGPDWFTKILTTRSSRRYPRTILGIRIVIAVWIVVIIAVLFSMDEWWAVVLIPFLTLDLWFAKKRWDVNCKRIPTPGAR